MARMFEYGFEENIDYIKATQKKVTLNNEGKNIGFILVSLFWLANKPKNPFTKQTDYIITIDMAKEISMIQRSEKCKQARLHFIECEVV